MTNIKDDFEIPKSMEIVIEFNTNHCIVGGLDNNYDDDDDDDDNDDGGWSRNNIIIFSPSLSLKLSKKQIGRNNFFYVL